MKRRKKKHAVVFDFDGTTTKVKDALVKLVNERALPKKAQRELSVLHARYFAPAMDGVLSAEHQAEWLKGTIDVYIRYQLTMPEAYQAVDHVDLRHGVRQCLARLRAAGVPVAIVSFGVRQFIRRVLSEHGILSDSPDAICAADLAIDPISRIVVGWRPETIVIPDNKGEWSRRFADHHGVRPEDILAVGDTRGDATIGHLKENRLGIASTAQDAGILEACMGEVVVSEDFAPVTEWLFRKMDPS